MLRGLEKAGAVLVIVMISLAPLPQLESSTLNIAYGRSWPRSIVVDSSRQLVYVDGVSGIYPPEGFSFGIINSSSETLSKVIALPVTAGDLALDEGTGIVYVAGNSSVVVFDPRAMAFDRIIPLKIAVAGIAFDGSTGYLLISSGNCVFQLDPLTGRLLRNATVGNSAQGMVVDQGRGEVFVANYLSSSVSALSTADLSTLATIGLPQQSYPSQLALDPQRGVLYATTDGADVVMISSASDSVFGSVRVSSTSTNSTYALALDPGRNRLFVAAEPGTRVTELDSSTGNVLSTYSLDSAAFEMAVDPSTGRLYVTNYHQVTVIIPAEVPKGGQQLVQLAALVGVAVAVAIGVYVWRFTPSGGRLDGSPSRPRTAPSSLPSSHR